MNANYSPNKISKNNSPGKDQSKIRQRMQARAQQKRFQEYQIIEGDIKIVDEDLEDLQIQLDNYEDITDVGPGNNGSLNLKIWMSLIDKKKMLNVKKDRLKNQLKELELQEKQAELHAELRILEKERISLEVKSKIHKLTDDIANIVYQRDRLVEEIDNLVGQENILNK